MPHLCSLAKTETAVQHAYSFCPYCCVRGHCFQWFIFLEGYTLKYTVILCLPSFSQERGESMVTGYCTNLHTCMSNNQTVKTSSKHLTHLFYICCSLCGGFHENEAMLPSKSFTLKNKRKHSRLIMMLFESS